MKKIKIKQPIKRFLFLKEAKKNTLINFRNNVKIKGCYLTIRWIYPAPYYGQKNRNSIAVPVRYKDKFEIGDVVFLNQRAKVEYLTFFKPIDCRKREKLYFKVVFVEEQETWDGPLGPYHILHLGIKKLTNLEFLVAMGELKKGRQK